MQQTQGAKPTATEVARAQLAGFLTTPLIEPAERAWSPADLTHHQQLQRIRQETAMRKGELRGIPSVFGDL